jgi:hypothetical protein
LNLKEIKKILMVKRVIKSFRKAEEIILSIILILNLRN